MPKKKKKQSTSMLIELTQSVRLSRWFWGANTPATKKGTVLKYSKVVISDGERFYATAYDLYTKITQKKYKIKNNND